MFMPNSMGVSNPMMVPINMSGQDPNGFVMIDPLNTNGAQLSKQQLVANAANAKLKRRKRKGRNKKSDEAATPADAGNQQQQKLVTLRNPLFHGNSELRQPMPTIGRSAAQLPLQIDQPAAIIKNDNGMFTIRNPALHQAISNGVLSGNGSRSSYGPEHNYIVPEAIQNDSFYSNNSTATNSSGAPKHTVAIGSEVKHAQQKKQQQNKQQQQQQMLWSGNNIGGIRNPASSTTSDSPVFNNIGNMKNQSNQAFSSYDNQSPYGFNDFFGTSPVTVPATSQGQGNYYNGNGFGSYSNGTTNDCGYLFGNSQHRCDDSPPLSSTNNYYEGLTQGYTNKYDDMTFLYNLQPGQRLNNEVRKSFFFFLFIRFVLYD